MLTHIISATDGNTYSVVEASDWFSIAIDLLINPGRTGKGIRAKLGDFLQWFAVKGFYAEAYVALNRAFRGLAKISASNRSSAAFWSTAGSTRLPMASRCPVQRLRSSFLRLTLWVASLIAASKASSQSSTAPCTIRFCNKCFWLCFLSS